MTAGELLNPRLLTPLELEVKDEKFEAFLINEFLRLFLLIPRPTPLLMPLFNSAVVSFLLGVPLAIAVPDPNPNLRCAAMFGH